MRKYLNKIYVIIFLLLSCSNSRPNAIQSNKVSVQYFSNKHKTQFFRLFCSKDECSLFGIDKKHFSRCWIQDTTSVKYLECKTNKSADNELSKDRHDELKYSLENFFKGDRNNLVISDSITFWRHSSTLLDTSLFILPDDKDLLDFTYENQKVDQKVLINKLSLEGIKNLENIPTLFFDVCIDRRGKIVNVTYNSWGKSIYKKLIPAIEEELLKKAIRPYTILEYPISVKLPIGVVVN